MEISKSTAQDKITIDENLIQFNQQNVPFTQNDGWIDVSRVLKNTAGEIISGLNATLYCWRILYVDVLFVDPAQRGQGHGRALLAAVEAQTKDQGAYMAHLDTFDWQGKAFYERSGYTVFGTLENCPPGHQRFFLSKIL